MGILAPAESLINQLKLSCKRHNLRCKPRPKESERLRAELRDGTQQVERPSKGCQHCPERLGSTDKDFETRDGHHGGLNALLLKLGNGLEGNHDLGTG